MAASHPTCLCLPVQRTQTGEARRQVRRALWPSGPTPQTVEGSQGSHTA